MGKQRAYNKEYKVQAIKLAHEIGSTKAANELVKEGRTLTDAAMLSGFSNYSSFYRAYVKTYKKNPRIK